MLFQFLKNSQRSTVTQEISKVKEENKQLEKQLLEAKRVRGSR
jgi:hypothetical protein